MMNMNATIGGGGYPPTQPHLTNPGYAVSHHLSYVPDESARMSNPPLALLQSSALNAFMNSGLIPSGVLTSPRGSLVRRAPSQTAIVPPPGFEIPTVQHRLDPRWQLCWFKSINHYLNRRRFMARCIWCDYELEGRPERMARHVLQNCVKVSPEIKQEYREEIEKIGTHLLPKSMMPPVKRTSISFRPNKSKPVQSDNTVNKGLSTSEPNSNGAPSGAVTSALQLGSSETAQKAETPTSEIEALNELVAADEEDDDEEEEVEVPKPTLGDEIRYGSAMENGNAISGEIIEPPNDLPRLTKTSSVDTSDPLNAQSLNTTTATAPLEANTSPNNDIPSKKRKRSIMNRISNSNSNDSLLSTLLNEAVNMHGTSSTNNISGISSNKRRTAASVTVLAEERLISLLLETSTSNLSLFDPLMSTFTTSNLISLNDIYPYVSGDSQVLPHPTHFLHKFLPELEHKALLGLPQLFGHDGKWTLLISSQFLTNGLMEFFITAKNNELEQSLGIVKLSLEGTNSNPAVLMENIYAHIWARVDSLSISRHAFAYTIPHEFYICSSVPGHSGSVLSLSGQGTSHSDHNGANVLGTITGKVQAPSDASIPSNSQQAAPQYHFMRVDLKDTDPRLLSIPCILNSLQMLLRFFASIVKPLSIVPDMYRFLLHNPVWLSTIHHYLLSSNLRPPSQLLIPSFTQCDYYYSLYYHFEIIYQYILAIRDILSLEAWNKCLPPLSPELLELISDTNCLIILKAYGQVMKPIIEAIESLLLEKDTITLAHSMKVLLVSEANLLRSPPTPSQNASGGNDLLYSSEAFVLYSNELRAAVLNKLHEVTAQYDLDLFIVSLFLWPRYKHLAMSKKYDFSAIRQGILRLANVLRCFPNDQAYQLVHEIEMYRTAADPFHFTEEQLDLNAKELWDIFPQMNNVLSIVARKLFHITPISVLGRDVLTKYNHLLENQRQHFLSQQHSSILTSSLTNSPYFLNHLQNSYFYNDALCEKLLFLQYYNRCQNTLSGKAYQFFQNMFNNNSIQQKLQAEFHHHQTNSLPATAPLPEEPRAIGMSSVIDATPGSVTAAVNQGRTSNGHYHSHSNTPRDQMLKSHQHSDSPNPRHSSPVISAPAPHHNPSFSSLPSTLDYFHLPAAHSTVPESSMYSQQTAHHHGTNHFVNANATTTSFPAPFYAYNHISLPKLLPMSLENISFTWLEIEIKNIQLLQEKENNETASSYRPRRLSLDEIFDLNGFLQIEAVVKARKEAALARERALLLLKPQHQLQQQQQQQHYLHHPQDHSSSIEWDQHVSNFLTELGRSVSK